jgi:hypothetical protein
MHTFFHGWRRKAGVIVIGAALVVMVYGAIRVYSTYQLEQRIGQRIESHGGHVGFRDCGPDWILEETQFFDRIDWVVLSDRAIPANLQLLDVGCLTNLESLELRSTGVTDAGLKHLKGLMSLKDLNLSYTQVTNAGIMSLQVVENLRTLGLNGTQITDDGLQILEGSMRLEELFLNDTQITNAGLGHLKHLTQLKVLSVISTQITDSGLEHLNNLKSL